MISDHGHAQPGSTTAQMLLTFAFCTYNRAARLEQLVAAMRAQDCPVPFEILAVNNNSQDNTLAVLEALSREPGAALRFVTETQQGIVPARNRAIAESLDSDILVFIDDDELPDPGLTAAVHHAVVVEGAQCVGGRIGIDYTPNQRPVWMTDELQAFLGAVDYGDRSLWVIDDSHPLWSGNIAYDMSLFRDDLALRFDARYNRAGFGVGGGEDAMMFRELLRRGTRIRYRPDMSIRHLVDDWKLDRRYFLRLHYAAGKRYGTHRIEHSGGHLLGMPPWLLRQLLEHTGRWLGLTAGGRSGRFRQAMTIAHTLGMLNGYRQRAADAATSTATDA